MTKHDLMHSIRNSACDAAELISALTVQPVDGMSLSEAAYIHARITSALNNLHKLAMMANHDNPKY